MYIPSFELISQNILKACWKKSVKWQMDGNTLPWHNTTILMAQQLNAWRHPQLLWWPWTATDNAGFWLIKISLLQWLFKIKFICKHSDDLAQVYQGCNTDTLRVTMQSISFLHKWYLPSYYFSPYYCLKNCSNHKISRGNLVMAIFSWILFIPNGPAHLPLWAEFLEPLPSAAAIIPLQHAMATQPSLLSSLATVLTTLPTSLLSHHSSTMERLTSPPNPCSTTHTG